MAITAPLRTRKRVNPMDEILWSQIREAVERVVTRPQEEITVEIGVHKAVVIAGSRRITITLTEVEPDQPTLITPPN